MKEKPLAVQERVRHLDATDPLVQERGRSSPDRCPEVAIHANKQIAVVDEEALVVRTVVMDLRRIAANVPDPNERLAPSLVVEELRLESRAVDHSRDVPKSDSLPPGCDRK